MRIVKLTDTFRRRQRMKERRSTGALIHKLMGRKFDFEGIVDTLPGETFETAFSLKVGDTRIELGNVGPAHTKGDVLAHLPQRRTVFTGDIVFAGGHPTIWSGPVENWISARDLILGWDVEIVVPGHGSVSDKESVREIRSYLVALSDTARKRYEAGMSWTEAAEEIVADHFRRRIDRERVFINVASLYRQFSGGIHRLNVTEIYEPMARWYWANKNAAAPTCC